MSGGCAGGPGCPFNALPPPPVSLSPDEWSRAVHELRLAYSSTVRAHVDAAHARDRYWWQAWGLMWCAIGYACAHAYSESLVDALTAGWRT